MEHQHQTPGLAQISPRPLGLVQGPMGAGFKGLIGPLLNLLIKGPIQQRHQPVALPHLRQHWLAWIGPGGSRPQGVAQGLQVGPPPGKARPIGGQTQLGGQGRLQGKTLAWAWQLASKPARWAPPGRPQPARGESH